MDSGPGSDPRLHEQVTSYSHQPVFAAQFIPAAEASPPKAFHYLLFELKNRVYGQVLVEYKRRRYPEHPLNDPVSECSSIELKWESRDHSDPLVVAEQTIRGLEYTISKIAESEPVLDLINVVQKNYHEIGELLESEYGTPFAEYESDFEDPETFATLNGTQSQIKSINDG
jgi:hypothetical protein